MKKKIVYVVLILVVVIGLLSYGIYQRVKLRNEVREKLQNMTITRLFSLDSSEFRIPPSRPIVILYFNSECDICRNELVEIKENISKFEPASVILVSSENISAIKKVEEDFDLPARSNIFFTKLNSSDLYFVFGSVSVPHIFIYGKNSQLVKEFRGETKVEAILKYCR